MGVEIGIGLRLSIDLTFKIGPNDVQLAGPFPAPKKQGASAFRTEPPFGRFRRRVPFQLVFALREIDVFPGYAHPGYKSGTVSLLADRAMAMGAPVAGPIDLETYRTTEAAAPHHSHPEYSRQPIRIHMAHMAVLLIR